MIWLSIKTRWLWEHRTKTAGVLMGIAAGIQSTLAQYGHVIPLKWHGVLLGIAAMITFLIGLYNTFAQADPPP
jgi:hypothetical protein